MQQLRESIASSSRAFLSAAIVVALCVPTASWAGKCERTVRDWKTADASKLTVVNDSGQDLYLGASFSTSSGYKKVKDGDELSDRNGLGSPAKRQHKVDILVLDVQRGTRHEIYSCSLQIENFSKNSQKRTKWGDYSCTANDDNHEEYCPSCTLSCDKTWRDGKDIWDTTLTVTVSE